MKGGRHGQLLIPKASASVVLLGLLVSACSPDTPSRSAEAQSFASVQDIQRALASGRATSETLVVQALAAIHENQGNNAFISVDRDGSLARAKHLDDLRERGETLGPLHGVPLAVKDNIHVAGLPNTAGTPALRNFVPQANASAVDRLEAAGAIVIGKTNMHELAFGITSANRAFGAVANAHNPAYFAGGSSGGTAAAIGSGAIVAGLGTDTGGSSRIPAALNGIVGFRPTTGRYPSDGVTLISTTRDTVGPMGKTVGDVALLDSILSGEADAQQMVALADIRLGVSRHYFYDNLQADIQEATEDLLERLDNAGATVVVADLANVAELSGKVGFPAVIYESARLLDEYMQANIPEGSLATLVESIASPDVKGLMQSVLDPGVPAEVYEEAINVYRPQLQQLYRDYFAANDLDAMIFPTTPLTARPIAGSDETVLLNGQQVPTFLTFIRNTDPGSNAGIPGLTIPLGVSGEGLPFGIEIDGPEGSDRRLLAIGALLESLVVENSREAE